MLCLLFEIILFLDMNIVTLMMGFVIIFECANTLYLFFFSTNVPDHTSDEYDVFLHVLSSRALSFVYFGRKCLTIFRIPAPCEFLFLSPPSPPSSRFTSSSHEEKPHSPPTSRQLGWLEVAEKNGDSFFTLNMFTFDGLPHTFPLHRIEEWKLEEQRRRNASRPSHQTQMIKANLPLIHFGHTSLLSPLPNMKFSLQFCDFERFRTTTQLWGWHYTEEKNCEKPHFHSTDLHRSYAFRLVFLSVLLFFAIFCVFKMIFTWPWVYRILFSPFPFLLFTLMWGPLSSVMEYYLGNVTLLTSYVVSYHQNTQQNAYKSQQLTSELLLSPPLSEKDTPE
jgi:hypothetical protein